MSDTPCVDGRGQDAATIERLREQLARLTQVLHEWGALSTAGDIVSAEDFAEAIEENGAWRLARDLRAALSSQNVPQDAVDAPEAPGQPGRDEEGSGGRTAALARALHSHTYPWCRQPDTECHCGDQAERIGGGPGPLLAALAEAGVLRQSEPTIHPTWNRERCLDHLADLDQKIRSLHDRAEWLRQQAQAVDDAAVLTLNQFEHFIAMIAKPSDVLDMRPGSFQEGAPDARP